MSHQRPPPKPAGDLATPLDGFSFILCLCVCDAALKVAANPVQNKETGPVWP